MVLDLRLILRKLKSMAWILCLAQLLSAGPANASIYQPLVQMGASSGGRLGMLLWGLLAVLLFGLIQAFVLRLFARKRSLIACTLLFGALGFIAPVDVRHLDSLWHSVTVGLSVLTAMEFVILITFRMAGKRNILRYALIAILMNVAGGGVLSAVTWGMINIPFRLSDDAELAAGLPGALVVEEDSISSAMVIHPKDGPALTHVMYPDPSPDFLSPSSSGNLWLVNNADRAWMESTGFWYRVSSRRFPPGLTDVSAISPDGMLVLATWHGKRCVYDVASRKTQIVLPAHLSFIRNASFSFDNKYLAWDQYVRRDQVLVLGIRLLDLATRAERAIGIGESPVFSPRENVLAWLTRAKTGRSADASDSWLTTYDVARAATRRTLLRKEDCSGLAWSPDGKYLAFASSGSNDFVRVFDPTFLRVITADGKRTTTLCRLDDFTPDPLDRPIGWVK